MDFAGRLIDAEQRLAELPELERQLEDATAEIDRLRDDVSYLEKTLGDTLASPSWRLTGPLRRAKNALARRRRG